MIFLPLFILSPAFSSLFTKSLLPTLPFHRQNESVLT